MQKEPLYIVPVQEGVLVSTMMDLPARPPKGTVPSKPMPKEDLGLVEFRVISNNNPSEVVRFSVIRSFEGVV